MSEVLEGLDTSGRHVLPVFITIDPARDTPARLKSYFETSYMDRVFFAKVGILALITWTPIHLIYYISEWLDPSENQKLKQNNDTE